MTADQEFFRATTEKFLRGRVPADEIRRLRDDPTGFDPGYWRAGADLGWTSLLVAEAAGGGTLSGNPLADFALVAFEFGRHAAPGPLIPANIVAAALSDTGSHPEVLAELISGTAIATWCHAAAGRGPAFDAVDVEIREAGADLVLAGSSRPVEYAGAADHLLVTGYTDGALTQVLLPAATPGVTIEPLSSVDLTRRFGAVTFADVRVPRAALVGGCGAAAPQVTAQLEVALVAQCAEAVGAMQAGFDITVRWAADRYSFGRPLASYQALKHRFADMKSWLEAAHAIAEAAASAVDANAPDAAELVEVAKAYIGQHSVELLQECVQLHGGIGLTFEHDLHLFLRRAAVGRARYGTPAEHRQRIAARLIDREAAL
ncbi:acyl-CoA dehydrogenase family protein [Nocardia jiangsuensis]|uniref:Acyl-CoA dehydrogenase family protein n=1 Tax=Nocardia jiangsuensis TaxID=1691563 RepID=A0ABV8E0Q5_9NOCA